MHDGDRGGGRMPDDQRVHPRDTHRTAMGAGRLLAACVGIFALISINAGAALAPAREPLLPDLAQDPPAQVGVLQVDGQNGVEFRLGFRSAVRNIGDGPLIIQGRRKSAAASMQANQIVTLAGGGSLTYRNVIPMQYAYEATHDHFHVLRFDRYTLRDAETGVPVRPDNKSGFCLGDRKPVDRPRVKPPPYYGPLTGECERGSPESLRVTEGLTPGYLDDYGPQLEGQYIDITGVAAGRYSLVHRVNAGRTLRERNFRNDVASALIEISWPNGAQSPPAVSVLSRCRRRAMCSLPSAADMTGRRPVPVLTAAETSRFRLWCSLVDPVAPLGPAAWRRRAQRIAASERVWRAASRRARRRAGSR